MKTSLQMFAAMSKTERQMVLKEIGQERYDVLAKALKSNGIELAHTLSMHRQARQAIATNLRNLRKTR